MEATYKNRVFQMTEQEEQTPALFAQLLINGFDGKVYIGVSQPTGKQRVAKQHMFYRRAKNGEFVFVV